MTGTNTKRSHGRSERSLRRIVSGVATSDGDGVNLTRIVGSQQLDMVDPFLLFDLFEADHLSGPIGGFPAHPHRGFQTVTYMLSGRMRHEDNAGHQGVVEPGGVQWMSAGRGVVHSEMPTLVEGALAGFQLWVNLPACEKMTAPSYQEFTAADIPLETVHGGVRTKVIAGTTDLGTTGPVSIPTSRPLYFDVDLAQGAHFSQKVAKENNGFIYVIDGTVSASSRAEKLSKGHLGILGPGDHVEVLSTDAPARFLLIAGRRLNEPVAHGGPFVMNTRRQVLQAFDDYRNGRFQEA